MHRAEKQVRLDFCGVHKVLLVGLKSESSIFNFSRFHANVTCMYYFP